MRAPSRPDMDSSSVLHGGPAPRISSSFSVGSLDGLLANISHIPPLLSESVTLDSLSSRSSTENIAPPFPFPKRLPRCFLIGLGENLKFFSEPSPKDGLERRPTRVAISSPTSPRLKTMLKECLSIRQWAESSAGWQAPGHIPWSDLSDKASMQTWVPEGSVLPADFVSVALFQAHSRRALAMKARRMTSVAPGFVAPRPSTSDQVKSGEMNDIMHELTEFQYYFETLPQPMSKDLDDLDLSRPPKPSSLSGTTLAVPSLVISNSHFTLPLPLESSQSISKPHPTSLARRRGKQAPAPLLSPSKPMADIAYPDIPTAFLGSPSKELTPGLDSPASVAQDDFQSSLRFEEMINNLRLQCATMEVNGPPVDSTWNSRSVDPTTPEAPVIISDVPPPLPEDSDEWAFAKDLLPEVEKPTSLSRKPTVRAPKADVPTIPRKKPIQVKPPPPAAPQKPKGRPPIRKPPPTHIPADIPAERAIPVPQRLVKAKEVNLAKTVAPSSVPKPRPLPVDACSRVVTFSQAQAKGPIRQNAEKPTPPSRKPYLLRPKVKSPPKAVSSPGIASPKPQSPSSIPSTSSDDSGGKSSSEEDTNSSLEHHEASAMNLDSLASSAVTTPNSTATPGLRSAFMKKEGYTSPTAQIIKTVRFALPEDKLEDDDNLWSDPPRHEVEEVSRPAAPFAKSLQEEEDTLPASPEISATSASPSLALEEPRSLLQRSGNLVRKASWRVLPPSRITPPAKARSHSVTIGSPLRQSMTIPDPPPPELLLNTSTTDADEDDSENTPLIGTRPSRATHSLGRHSLSRIMSLRSLNPIFSAGGAGKENKRATIAFAGPSSASGMDENATRRGAQATGSAAKGANDPLQKKSRMPVPLRNILTRFK